MCRIECIRLQDRVLAAEDGGGGGGGERCMEASEVNIRIKKDRVWAEEFGSFNLVSEMTGSSLRYLTFHRIC